jgi:hypothetical protein
LEKNCNHFTSFLCEKLTGRPAPAWVNRAASIGVALPCVVPREWIAPPEYDTAEGELLEEEEDEGHDTHERSSMLRRGGSRVGRGWRDGADDEEGWDAEDERSVHKSSNGKGKGKEVVRDTSGRVMPVAERAPPPH